MQLDEDYADSGHANINQAARAGDLAAVKLFIEEGHDLDVPDNRGWIPLLDASYGGYTDCVQYLLQYGSHVAWKSHEGKTSLHLACEAGHVMCVDLLLQHGADVNASDFMQNSPLITAVREHEVEVVNLLLENGATVNSQQYCGTSPLHIAATDGDTQLTTLLLEHEADLDLAEDYGITPLFCTAQYGHTDCMKIILKQAEKLKDLHQVVNCQTADGATPLFIAAQEGHLSCVEMLLENGADANLSTSTPLACPLLAALQFNHNKIAERLIPLTFKETLNQCDIGVFYFSTMHTDAVCTQCLIDSGFDVNERRQLPDAEAYELKVLRFFQHQVRYSTYTSPLALTAILENPMCHTEALIAAGARLNPSSLYEVPPLLPALDRYQMDLVQCLIEHGAKCNIYHPKVVGNICLIASLHNWKGLNRMLLCGAEAESLFSRPGYAPLNLLAKSAQLDDVCSEEEDDYENEPGIHHGPVPLWQLLIEAKFVLSRRGITAAHILYKLMSFVASVWLDPRLASCLDTVKEWKVISQLQASPRDLCHLCRLVIRRQFSPRQLLTSSSIDILPLPTQVLDYLKYTDDVTISCQ